MLLQLYKVLSLVIYHENSMRDTEAQLSYVPLQPGVKTYKTHILPADLQV